LVVFTPKSLLRHPACTSTVAQCCEGTFQTCIVPPDDFAAARQVLFCSGKIYYELEEERIRLKRNDTLLVRIEQLYPLDLAAVESVLGMCGADCRLYWIQEEPENMGAWHHMDRHFRNLSASVGYIGRPEDACPAVGSHHVHAERQKEILKRAFSQLQS